MFITTSIFSKDAEAFAEKNKITMMSYKELEKRIN
ncbi:MAG: restriction endonuclease [bacterium]|nr:restriction endonuclease [bacterium]